MIDREELLRANPLLDVVGRYVTLTRQGSEYKGLCPFHSERTPSFYVVPEKGFYHCFGCGESGGNAIDFVMSLEGLDFPAAAERLGAIQTAPPPRLPPPLPDTSQEWAPILPVPDDAQPVDAGPIWNPKAGRPTKLTNPSRQDAYRSPTGDLLGYVLRWDIGDDRKICSAVLYCEHEVYGRRWCMTRFPAPLPLLGQEQLTRDPRPIVLIVEGEKDRAAAALHLPRTIVLTWPGGTANVERADWHVLRGRDCIVWLDNDEPGRAAQAALLAILAPLVPRLRYVDGSSLPEGGGAADVPVEDTHGGMRGWLADRVHAYVPPASAPAGPLDLGQAAAGEGTDLQPRLDVIAGVPDEPQPAAPRPAGRAGRKGAGSTRAMQVVNPDGSVHAIRSKHSPSHAQLPAELAELDLALRPSGSPHPNADNAARIFTGHPAWRGAIWFDDFLQRVRIQDRDGPRDLVDADEIAALIWFQRDLGLAKFGRQAIQDGIQHTAYAQRRNCLTEWLEGLVWDGVPRVDSFIHRAFGAELTPLVAEFSRVWLLSMIARAYQPGCKVDTMPIIESAQQGVGKNKTLEALGGEFFAECREHIESKDFVLALQGKWLVEISELAAFRKGDHERIKGLLSCRVDRIRAPYGVHTQDILRQCVFVGTSNRNDWHTDETGGRRFLPIAAGQPDDAWVHANREQLFAEARDRYRAGEQWWVREEHTAAAASAVADRRGGDPWDEQVRHWVEAHGTPQIPTILEYLGVKIPDQNIGLARRVGSILRSLGFDNRPQRIGKGAASKIVRIWERRVDDQTWAGSALPSNSTGVGSASAQDSGFF